MKECIRAKIAEALKRCGAASTTSSQNSGAVAQSSTVKYNTGVLVDDAIANPSAWTIKEIAERHRISYWTVYRQLKGKPGFLRFGGTIRVSESLYRSWLASSIESGLRRQSSSLSEVPAAC